MTTADQLPAPKWERHERRERLPSPTYLFVVGTFALVGAVVSALALILSDTDQEWAVGAYAGGLGLAAVAGALVAVMAEDRRKRLLVVQQRASRLIRAVESARPQDDWDAAGSDEWKRARGAVFRTVQSVYGGRLQLARWDAETLLDAGAFDDAQRLLDAIHDAREILGERPDNEDEFREFPR